MRKDGQDGKRRADRWTCGAKKSDSELQDPSGGGA
jgi:hypothetical protein